MNIRIDVYGQSLIYNQGFNADMRTYISTFLLFLLSILPSQLRADDASAISYEHWSYGHIKADTPNKQIALDKELMKVTVDSIYAIFIFRNTTNQFVETPCVFPINSYLEPIVEYEGDSAYFRAFQGTPNYLLWAIALDEAICSGNNDTCSVAKSTLKAADKRLRKYTYADYLARVKELTNSSYLSGCTITQNGENVPIRNVGIETRLDGGLILDAYFYHFLKFKPYEVSKVVVAYPIESFSVEYDGCRSYGIKYDISSGGTWKGNIKSFMVYSTMFMESNSSNFLNTKMGECTFSDRSIYFKKDYKPVADDYFHFGGGYSDVSCWTYMAYLDEDTKKARKKDYLDNDSCIKIVDARDELNPLVCFPKRQKRSSYVVNVTSSTKQDVSSLFDGDLYTSYLAPASSYIEFSITKPVLGPFVSNGFVSNSFNEKVFYAAQEEKNDRGETTFPVFQDSLWTNTSRVKTMTLTQVGSDELYSFSLADKYGVLPTEREDWQSVNAVHQPKILMPGRYRLKFNETYKGAKSNTVGLSEIWFYPYPEELISMVEEDRKDSFPLFQDCYGLVESEWVTDYTFVPYEMLRSQSSSYYREYLNKYGDDKFKLMQDSLGNYYVMSLEDEDTDLEASANATLNEGGEAEATVTSNSLLRYILIGVGLLAFVGGLLFFLRRKK